MLRMYKSHYTKLELTKLLEIFDKALDEMSKYCPSTQGKQHSICSECNYCNVCKDLAKVSEYIDKQINAE